jgi:hypothetical protein
MTEKWATPLAKKRVERVDDGDGDGTVAKRNASTSAAAIVQNRSRMQEVPDLPQLPRESVEDRLSTEPWDVARLEAYCRRIGFLDDSLGVHEQLHARDPMLLVFEAPMKPVVLGDGTQSTVIDELLKAGDEAFHKSCGSRYKDFAMVQYAVQANIASKDVHAKQMMFLGMLAIDRGFHDRFLASYPASAASGGIKSDAEGEYAESARFEPFMKTVKMWLDGVTNTMYVNVPAPTRYNVGDLTRKFLSKCVTHYPG